MGVEVSRPTVILLITLLLLPVVDQIFRGYASHLSRGRSAIEPRGPTAHSPQLPCLPQKGRRRRDPSAHAPILRHPCRSLGRRMVRQALTMPLSFSYPLGAAVPASDEGFVEPHGRNAGSPASLRLRNVDRRRGSRYRWVAQAQLGTWYRPLASTMPPLPYMFFGRTQSASVRYGPVSSRPFGITSRYR